MVSGSASDGMRAVASPPAPLNSRTLHERSRAGPMTIADAAVVASPAGAMMPSQVETEPETSMGASGGTTPRPWWDLGFSFTTRQALVLLGLLVVGVAFSYALD